MTSMPPGTVRQARHRSRAGRHPAGGIPGRLTGPALRLLIVHRLSAGSGAAAAEVPPVFVDRRTATALHRDLAAALRGDEIICAHLSAAEYWQWRAAGWPQDRQADLHDLLEARYHLREAGDSDRAGALTEVVCAQLHAWGDRKSTRLN